jgi:hypothetical protein
MVETVENKVVIGANVNIKNAFDDATKNFAEYFKTTDQFWKNATQRVKEQDEQAKKLAKRVSGKGKEDLAGAFDAAAAGLTGFSIGFVKGTREEVSKGIVDAVEKMVTAYADRETAENRLRASMHLTNEQLKTLFEQLHEFGPVVGKYPEQLAEEWRQLAENNEKLIDSFQPMQMFAAATKSNWHSVMALAGQAAIGGVKPADMPAFLDKSAQALMRTGEAGVKAGTMVLENFYKRGLQGPELQKQVAVIVSGLTPAFQNNPIAAANAMTAFMEPILEQRGNDSKMDNWIKLLKDGKITLIQFFDETLRRNDPASADFYLKLQADPRTRDLVKAWETQRNVIHELWQTEPTPLKDLAIFSESTEHELHRLAEALHELSVVVGGMSDAIEIIKALVAIVEDFTRKIKALKVDVDAIKGSVTLDKAWELYKDLWAISPAGMQWSTGKWLWNKAFPPSAPAPGEPGKPVRFTGSDDDDVHDMAMQGERGGAAFTPGAGESPWPMLAGVPTGDYGRGFDYGPAGVSSAGGAGAGGYYGGAGEGGGGGGGRQGPGPGSSSGPGPGASDTTSVTPAEAIAGDIQGDPRRTGGAFNVPAGSGMSGQRTTITLKNGQQVTVNARVAEQFKGFFNDMIDAGAPVHGLGGYGTRPSNPSQHPPGLAVDWSQSGRNVVSRDVQGWINQNPKALNELESKWGMSGGEHWRSPDTGHFSIQNIYGTEHLKKLQEERDAKEKASKPIKVSMEVEPPPRWQLERAARYTDQLGNRHAERQQQAKGAGDIGFA